MASKAAARIQRERKARSWGYRDLAEHLNCSVSTAHNLATGKNEPTLRTLRRLAKAFGCPMTDFLS